VSRLLLAAFSTFVALLFAELAVRTFRPQPDVMRWLTPDERYGHVMKRDFHQRFRFFNADFAMEVQTNSLGLRDREIEPETQGVPTILFSGDSFVFGQGVNVADRFDTKLRDLLERSGRRFRLINTGVNAWGTLQETRFAADNFQQFHPDVVVLVFCGNDPGDDAAFRPPRVSFVENRFPGQAFLRNHFHLYRLIARDAYILWYGGQQQAKRETAPPQDASASFDTQTASVITDEDWQSSLAAIRAFHRAFVSFNPDGVLLVMASNPANDNITEHLASLSDGAGIIYVDLRERARALGQGMKLPYDCHWSPAMHEAVAQELVKTIATLKTETR